jgi:DNA-3-methyladenine glycosylase I
MAVPERIAHPTTADALAVIARAVFQAGMSWKAIDVKWAAYLRLFEGFDPVLVAAFGEGDVERLLADGGIVRTRKKIVATIENARALVAIDAEFGGIERYMHAFES